MEINFEPTKKQFEAWEYLNDRTTNEVLFGGGAGSAKSHLGCVWLIINCLQYPGTRWLMGRAKLNILKNTTLKTFNDIVKSWNVSDRLNINYQSNTITFTNGSEIVMKDLFFYPSDAEFDSLGSLEISGAFIDEISQISFKAYEVVNTRIRYKLKEYNLIPKCLSSCNPSKGWLYNEFYKPFTENRLRPDRKFIQALATDNKYIDSNYITQLKKSSQAIQRRLLYGDWNYSDDIDSLFRYENIVKIVGDHIIPIGGQKYITADIARFGKDNTIIMVWSDLYIIDIFEANGIDTSESANKLKELANKWGVQYPNIIIDADGIGGGVVDQIPGVTGFINNSRPIENATSNNYQNLKAQCYYLLAELVENNLVKTNILSTETFELLAQELQCIKQKDIDGDGKLSIIPKEVMKKIIGRSPDYADCMMMRMLVELKPKARPIHYAVYM